LKLEIIFAVSKAAVLGEAGVRRNTRISEVKAALKSPRRRERRKREKCVTRK